MATIHIFIQSKTTGKSLFAAFLAQYLGEERGEKTQCADLDILFGSLKGFAALKATQVEVKDVPAYCRAIPQDTAHVIMDVSVGVFFDFCGQFRSRILPALEQGGHSPLLHTVITGGGQMMETYNGFHNLAENFPGLPFVVWLNPYYGEIAAESRSFEESGVFMRHKDAVRALVRLPLCTDLTKEDVRDMYTAHLTFKEALERTDNSIAVRSRLNKHRESLYAALKSANLCG